MLSVMQGANPYSHKACEVSNSIGRDADTAKLLPKRTRVLMFDLAT